MSEIMPSINSPASGSEQLEKSLAEKNAQIRNLSIELEKSRTISDQQNFGHEKEVCDLMKTVDTFQTEKLEYEIKVEGLEKQIDQLNGKLAASNGQIKDLSNQLEKFEKDTSSISMHSSIFLESIESRDKLISDLKNRVSDCELQNTELQTFKENAMKEMDSHARIKRQLLHKEQNFLQEKSLLHKEIAYLQAELESRTEEVLKLHRSNASSVLNFETKMAQIQEREKVAAMEKHEAQKLLDDQTEKVEKLLVSLSESREAELKLEEQFRSELGTQEKINEMRQRACNELEKRCDDLEKSSEELRGLLREASKVYGALESAKKQVEIEAQAKIDSQNEWILELQEESARINKALEALTTKEKLDEKDSGTKAISELLTKGLTLSQLYSEYMSNAEKLYEAQQENKSLNAFVSRAIQEQKEFLPIHEKLKQDHEESIQMIEFLNEDIKKLNKDIELQKMETLDQEEKWKSCKKENEKLEQQICDLSKQLTTVLVQLEALKTGSIPFSIGDQSPEHITCARDVIDQKLLTFADVTELQKKNMKLVASIRELSTHLEKTEEALELSRSKESNEEFDVALNELSQLREKNLKLQSSLAKVSSKALSLEQEKSALNQSTGLESLLNNSCNKSSDQHTVDLEQLTKAHTEAKQKLEKQIEESKAKLSETESQLDKLRIEKLQLLTQAEYNEERIKALDTNCETLQRQLATHEAKLQASQGTLGRQEGMVHALEERNQELGKQFACAQSMIEQLREEKILLKSNAEKLMAQREEFLDSRQSQSMILSHLDVIRRTVDKNSVDIKSHLEMQVYELSRTCAQLQAKIQSKSHSDENTISLTALQESLKEARSEAAHLKKELEKCKSQKSDPISIPSQKVSRPDQSYSGTSNVEEVESELIESKARIDYLLVKISGLEENIAKLKEICDYQEQQLSKANEAQTLAKDQLDNLQKEANELKEQNCLLTNQLSSTNVENGVWKSEMQKKLQEMCDEQEEKISEVKEAVKARENAEEARQLALQDLQAQLRVAHESQSKYEKEVKLHSADLQTLNVVREKLQQAISENTDLKTLKEKLEGENNALQAQFTKKETELKSSADGMGKRAAELEEQNQTLLSQFTELSAKMCSLQTDLPAMGEEGELNPLSSVTQLQEMINFLRKEKEIHLCRIDATQMEAERLQTQKKNLERQVDVLQKSLHDEQQKSQELAECSKASCAMARKVETIDALSDSNKLLREEKEMLSTTVAQLSAKVATLEQELNPYHNQIAELKSKVDSLAIDKKCVFDEKEMYRNRCQELVEKLNKANPDDLAKLRKDLKSANQDLETKNIELTLLRSQATNLQKAQQTIMNNKNQLQIQLNAAREELKSVVEESKKFSQEKIRIQQQAMAHMEKTRNLEVNQNQTLVNHRAELQSINAQVCELMKKEEASRSMTESIRKDNESKEKKILELSSKNENLERQAVQLRRIALKYKEKAGSSVQYSEGPDDDGDANEKVKELEERVKLLTQELERKASVSMSTSKPATLIQALPVSEAPPAVPQTQQVTENTDKAQIESLQTEDTATPIKTDAQNAAKAIEPSGTALEYQESPQVMTEPLEISLPELRAAIEVSESIQTEELLSDAQSMDSRKRKCPSDEAEDDCKKPRVEDVETAVADIFHEGPSDSMGPLDETSEPPAVDQIQDVHTQPALTEALGGSQVEPVTSSHPEAIEDNLKKEEEPTLEEEEKTLHLE